MVPSSCRQRDESGNLNVLDITADEGTVQEHEASRIANL